MITQRQQRNLHLARLRLQAAKVDGLLEIGTGYARLGARIYRTAALVVGKLSDHPLHFIDVFSHDYIGRTGHVSSG